MSLPLPMLAICIAFVLSGCRSASDTAASPIEPSAAAPASADRNVAEIRGRATYLERVKMPPGADLVVRMIDRTQAESGRDVIAETTLEDVAGPPYDFSLRYDPAKLRGDGRYVLHAALHGPEGQLWFATESGVPVVPGSDDVVEFRMARVPGPDEGTPPASQAVNHWQCGELLLASRIEGDAAKLSFSGRRLQLPQATAASGARYADGKGNEFWNKGDSTLFTLAGGERRDCTRSARSSPWNEAEARGVAFRAVGNEPGWFVEVDMGEAAPLRATLDYGERKIEVPRTVSLSSTHGFGGKTADGTAVVLRIKREPCSDGMSGEAFEASAELKVGGNSYRGCGAYLLD